MSIYTFTFNKLKEKIQSDAVNMKCTKLGFIQRHSDNKMEMLAKASALCNNPLFIDARHLFFNYNNQDAILCIEDYGKIDVSQQIIDLVTEVKDEFHDDFIDDETSSWKMLVFEDNAVYELTIVSVELLTDEQEVIIKCSGCKRKYE